MALVGIARLASQSELLEAKRAVQYFEIPARSILNRTKPNMPFRWTINPYRGCEFGCKYCYARYTHEFMEMDATDFEDKIYAKSAAAHLCEQNFRFAVPSNGVPQTAHTPAFLRRMVGSIHCGSFGCSSCVGSKLIMPAFLSP